MVKKMTKEQAKEILLDRKELSSPELEKALDIAIECIEKQIAQDVDKK